MLIALATSAFVLARPLEARAGASEAETLTEAQMEAFVRAASEARAAYAAQIDVEIDLAGGSLSGLSAEGWVQGASPDTWSKGFETAETLRLSAPVRHGYLFEGWDADADGAADIAPGGAYTVGAEEAPVLTAVWKRADFSVSFIVEGATALTVSVPYESVLWSDGSSAPWEGAAFGEAGTATVDISYEGVDHPGVEVTRHGEAPVYWYSFELEVDGVQTGFFALDGHALSSAPNRPFSWWKMTQGGGGYRVLEDGTVFTAQFEQDPVYVVNVHYRTVDGLTVATSETKVAQAADVGAGGRLEVTFAIPAVDHYTLDADGMAAYTVDGNRVDGSLASFTGAGSAGVEATASIDVEGIFGTDLAQAGYLSIVVTFVPQEVSYTVRYFQQDPDRAGYTEVTGGAMSGTARYGDRIAVADRAFTGFKVSGRSRLALLSGADLVDPGSAGGDISWDGASAAFTINIYYDRASYFIYPLWDSTESTVSAQRVTYGAAVDGLDAPERTGYEFAGWTWYRLDGETGKLVGESVDYAGTGAAMPAYDLYAVAQWKPVEVPFQLVLWLEDADSPSYSNVYQTSVSGSGVEAGDRLTVSLEGDELAIAADGGATPLYRSSDLLAAYVKQAYQGDGALTSEDYAQFFSYDRERTQQSPGNISLAEEAGDTVSGGQLGSGFSVSVGADGTTSINVYYSRNLYSIDFVLGRAEGSETQVSVNTRGTIASSDWESLKGGITGFEAEGLEEAEDVASTGWIGSPTVLRASGAEERSPVGRFGKKAVTEGSRTYTCIVYQLTAKFEASVDAFWPTLDRVQIGDATAWKRYVSDSPASGSYYRDVVTAGSDQHNILNVYGIMDEKVLLTSDGAGGYRASASDDQGGTVAHRMVAYWSDGEGHNANMTAYRYFFLYEVLDTAVSPDSPGVTPFEVDRATSGAYAEGELVSHGGRVYAYTLKSSAQLSTFGQSGQNQPSLKGFESAGKLYEPAPTSTGGRPQSDSQKNIYFFYNREVYALTLHNLSETYVLPADVWTEEHEGSTLAQLGWERAADGSASVRYGASLAPLGDASFMSCLTDAARGEGRLAYPIAETGENQRYFRGWALNQKLSIKADWSEGSALLAADGNVTLYAEWSTPRYTVSYALNGGTWQDEGDSRIDYTLVTAAIPVADGSSERANVFLAYTHQAAQSDARNTALSWYVQTQDTDRLYIDTLYETTLDQVMVWDGATDHWRVRDGLTLADLSDASHVSAETSFTGRYYCYMGQGGADEGNSHRKYVNVNKWLGDALGEPAEPVRNGYAFAGWYEFAQGDYTASPKVYLADELEGTDVSIDAYRAGYVYLDGVDDAHLLHADADGSLFYYADQTGYRLSFEYHASTVTATKVAYAAWVPEGDVDLTVMHLVRVADTVGVSELGGSALDGLETVTLSVGGVDTACYVLREDVRTVSNGAVETVRADDSFIDDASKVWLPDATARRVSITDATQTATVSAEGDSAIVALDDLSGSYRVKDDDGTYSYRAFFIYEKTDQVQYHVYAVNLPLAVASGSLATFDDTFDRADPPASDASFVLAREDRSHTLAGAADPTVSVRAPELSGYTVYRDTAQELSLASDDASNNVYFYYVPSDGSQRYTITYHLMHGGSYETGRTVAFTDVPAAQGESIRREQLTGLYDSLVSTAYMVDGYATADSSTNEGKLFERYRGMTVMYREDGSDEGRSFTVGGGSSAESGAGDAAALGRDEALALNDGAVYDGHNPTNEVQVVENGSQIDVYLRYAQLTVNKLDWQDSPVAGCAFTLTRLARRDDATPEGADTVLYDLNGDGTAEQYVVDAAAAVSTATSDGEGKAVFFDLFADERYAYLLEETSAPAGYAPLGEPVALAVPQRDEAGEMVYAVTYTVRNNGVVKLPYTGFWGGVYTPLIVGGALVAAAAVLAALRPGARRGRGASGGRRSGR